MRPSYRQALYQLIENTVTASGSDSALFEAFVPRTSRGRVSQDKTIKVVSGPGIFDFGGEASRKARDCVFTIQCWVTPERPDDDEALEEALDTAMTMAEELFDAIHSDQTLGGAVCLCDADGYDAEYASHGGMIKAAAYLDGTINPTGDITG